MAEHSINLGHRSLCYDTKTWPRDPGVWNVSLWMRQRSNAILTGHEQGRSLPPEQVMEA